ncbi:DNRLRE domain-containing protein [Micromonospora sp. NPDC048905]|uniref:DNRLRE domain-containing protein n=1 Tax=unclassified Micromonospora TaxID=2617518 RepID=UPI0033C15CF1
MSIVGNGRRLIAVLVGVVLVVSGSPAYARPAGGAESAPRAGTVLRPPTPQGRDVPDTPPGPAKVLPSVAQPTPAEAIPPARRVRELVDRRTASTKVYLLADGRMQAEASREPVHYRDGKGRWQDIQSTVSAGDSSGYPFAATRNTFAGRFGDRSDRVLSYSMGDYGLTLGLAGGPQALRPTAKGSRVTYPGALGGADLVYEVTPSAIKEQIVLAAAPSGPATYTFTLDVDSVRAVPEADGSLSFFATDWQGPALFTMPRPYMYDSADDQASVVGKAMSYQVSQRVSQQDGRTVVTVSADDAWLRDPARKYPVVIDPTIKVQPTLNQAQDVMLASGGPTENFDSTWKLSAGASTGGTFRSLTKFDLSKVPANTVLDSAQLQMYFDQTHGGADDSAIAFEARRVTAAWNETTATWSSMSAKFAEVGENREQVDEAETAKVSASGEWVGATATDRSLANNGAYRYNADASTGQTFTWVPRLTEDGQYEVYVHYVPGSDRATNAPYTVFHDGGSVVKTVNQTTGSGSQNWVSIGTYGFKAGTTHKVVLGDVANKKVVADAVRLVKRAEVTKPLNQTNAWHSYSVRSIVQGWLDNPATNYGFMLKGKDETNKNGGPRYESGDFSYGGEDDHGPKLVLTWGKPGVALNPVTTVRATGADLSWSSYTDPSSSPDDDLVEYQVHSSKTQNFMPNASTLVAPIRPGRTTYSDTHATPTPANSSTQFGEAYFYMVAVRLRDGTVIPAQTQMVRLPKAGQVIRFFTGADDNTLTSAKPDNNWDKLDAGGELQVGNKGSIYGNSRVVLKFPNVTGLPAQAKIVNAQVGLWGWYTEGDGAGQQQFQLRGLTQNFSETTSTWKSAQSGIAWNTAGGDVESTVQSTVSSLNGDPGWVNWEAGPLVQRWVDSASNNKGVQIRLANEAGVEQRVLFLSAEAAEPSLRPRLRVIYTVPNNASTYHAPNTPSRMIPGDQYLVPVTVTNTTSSSVWSPSDWVLSYHWTRPDGTPATNAGNPIETPLPSAQAPGGVVTINATVKAPAGGGDGDRREDYVLKWDLRNKNSGQWLSEGTQIQPLDQAVAVEDPTSDQLGLEKFYQYAGGSAGSGSSLMVNQFSGNAVFGYNPLANPSRGVSTFVRLTYNSQDTSTSSMGLGWSLSTTSAVRLGSPLQFRGGDSTWPQQVAMTDGDGTTHLFNLDKHNSANTADWRYVQPAGVHLYLQRTGSGDTSQAWTMTRPDRSQFVFDEQGYQSAVRDRNGNQLLFTYERMQVDYRNTAMLRYLTDPENRRTLSLDYYAAGDSYTAFVNGTKQSLTNLQDRRIINQLKSITDVSGRVMSFVYSDGGLLREVTDGSGTADAKPFGFVYDESQGPQNARLTRVVDPRTAVSKIAYNEAGDQFLQGKVNMVTDRLLKNTLVDYQDPDGDASDGVLTTVTDPKGRATESLIDGFGRATRITNALNQATLLGWDADNNVSRLEEAGGAISTWRFDQVTGYPLEVKDPEANRNNTPGLRMDYRYGLAGHTAELTDKYSPEGRHWKFGYDTVGNLTSVTDPKGTATSLEGDYTSSYAYDPFGRMTKATDANKHSTDYADYDPVGYPRKITNPLTEVTKYTYSSIGSVLTVTDPKERTTTYTYDGFGRPLTQKVPKDAANGVYITTPAPVYDKNDNATQQTSPTGAVTTAVYDALDRPSTVTTPKDTSNSEASTTKYDYDQVGNVIKVTEPKGMLTPADTLDYATVYVYDELNRPKEVTDALNGRLSIDYDLAGNVRQQIDQRKNATSDPNDWTAQFTYDLNRRVKTTIDPKGNSTGVEYDRDGNPTVAIDQDGNRSLMNYDERSALIEQKVPYQSSGGTITYRTTKYEYDGVGNLSRQISPRGVETTNDPDDFTTVTLYDAVNRVREVQQPYDRDDSQFTTPSVTKYQYDTVGNLELISAPPSNDQSARNDTVQTFFDNGWIRTSKDVGWNITTTYDYDNNGAQTSRTVAGASGTPRQMDWTYYPDGKKKSQSDNGAGSGTPSKNFAYEYDVNSNLAKMLDTSTGAAIDTYAVSYDMLNRVASVEEKKSTAVKNTTTFSYEPNDLLKKRTHDTQISEYTYETERDLASEIKNSTSPTDPKPKYTRYTYNKRGQTATETKGNGNVVTTDYFLNGSVQSQVEKKSGGAVVNQHTYEYEANGQKSKDVSHKQNADNRSAYVDTTSTFAYDPQDRIRTVTKTGSGAGTESYVHDANSNVVKQTVGGVTTDYEYDKNRLKSAKIDGVEASYAYDPYGRLKTVTSLGITLESYTYDGFDHVVTNVKNPGNKTTNYTYDPLDRQATRTYGGKTTTYAYLGLTGDISAELEGTKVVKSYQRGPGGDLLSQVKTNTDDTQEDSYVGYDGSSDIGQITDDKGDGRATYGYSAYGKNDAGQFTGVDKPDAGNPENPDKAPYNAYRFQSKRFDQSTGDYDMGFRDYDPGINQFLSRDSYNGALDDLGLAVDPYTGNRYAFAGGNPISNVELDGHNWLSDAADEVGDFVKDAASAIGSDVKEAGQNIAQAAYDTAVADSPAVDKETSDAAKGRNKERGESLKKTLSNPGQAVKDWSDGLTNDVKSGHPGKAAGHLLFDAFSIAAGGGGGGAAKGAAATGAKGGAGGGGLKLGSKTGGNCLSNSFVPGTLVLMADGSTKPIEAVELGDQVLASSPETGETEAKPVTRLIRGEGERDLVDVAVAVDGAADGETADITATAGHPFWVEDEQRWIEAGQLIAGDQVVSSDGRELSVVSTRRWTEHATVYNLTVDDIHTYYVLAGTTSVLVHNCTPDAGAMHKSATDPLNGKAGDSAASRAYQKHMGRPNTSLIPLRSGKDRVGMSNHLIEDLLTNSKTATQRWNHPEHGGVIDQLLPDIGARWKANGDFVGFLDHTDYRRGQP